jgi:hypothetical protein
MPRVPIDPNRIFRECDARDIFGYGPSQLREKIKTGAIPKPVLLSAPPSRARGWYGWMINDYREKVDAEQQAWTARNKEEFYVPIGGDDVAHTNKEAAKAVAAKPTVKKRKLRKPVKS